MRPWRDSLKNMIKPLLFFFIFVLIFLAVQEIMTPKWRFKPTNGSDGEIDKYGQFYALPDNTVDYLILGNSTSYHGISPTLIYAEAGITGYALGNSMQRAELSYYWLREALKSQSPSVVFFDVDSLLLKTDTANAFLTKAIVPMKFSWNKIETILNCKNDSQTFAELMFPLVQFHSRWTSLTENDWITGNLSDYCMNGAYVDFSVKLDTAKNEIITEYNTTELKNDTYTIQNSSTEIDAERKYYFERILGLCDENNIELIPIKAPTMSWNEAKGEIMRAFLKEYGLELLNFTDESLIQLIWNQDTRDNGNHANYWGSAKASDYLAGYLEERGLPDHRGQNGYEDWDRILENYQEWEQEQLLTDQEAAYAYLNTLANIKKDVLTIVTVKDEASQAWNETLETAIHNLGISSSFYHQIQNSFVAIIDGGISQFEKWDDHRIKVNSNYQINESELLKLSISSAGFVCGNLSSIMVNGTGYSLNTRGLNIVVIDKQTGQVISSASIDTHTSDLTFREKKLSEAQSAVWERVTYEADRLVEDGVYNIIPSGNPECAVDIPYGDTAENVNVWLCSRNGLSPQEFELHYIGKGLYMIRAVCSEKYLSIERMGSTAGSNVVQQTYSGLANQKWFITKNANGSYRFTSLYNGQVLDVAGGGALPGTNIQVWTENNEPPQEFFLERVNQL